MLDVTRNSGRSWFIVAVWAGISAALPVSVAWAETMQTCSDAHAYCMRLCTNATLPPPPGWTCEVERCFGLPECLSTGHYRIGTQYGHRPSNRTTYGPYEKK